MFNPDNLKVGDVFYSVLERNTAFHRKKIHKVIDGEDWFKYDRPSHTYEIVTHTVLGILRKQLEGQWKPNVVDYDLPTEFYVKTQNETHANHEIFDIPDGEKYFVDIEEAMVYKKLCEEETRVKEIGYTQLIE